jgi:hypothetical protein
MRCLFGKKIFLIIKLKKRATKNTERFLSVFEDSNA